jgi:hypothetical protein
MESFLRAMREVCTSSFPLLKFIQCIFAQVERHPHVLHLPAPHIWQIAPGSSKLICSNQTSNLVVTVEIHVRPELGDEDVLELTRWAWQRVVVALGEGKGPGLRDWKMEGNSKWRNGPEAEGDGGGPEVTVGIVRG